MSYDIWGPEISSILYGSQDYYNILHTCDGQAYFGALCAYLCDIWTPRTAHIIVRVFWRATNGGQTGGEKNMVIWSFICRKNNVKHKNDYHYVYE